LNKEQKQKTTPPSLSISKTIGCHFWLGLVARPVIWGHSVLIFGGGGGFFFWVVVFMALKQLNNNNCLLFLRVYVGLF
jgi:hypothetical protein